MRKMMVTLIVLLSLMVASCHATEYEEGWSTWPRADISKALVAAGAKDCGYYKHKKELNSSEYYVRCERYDYLVFTSSGKASGPYKKDPSMD